MALVILDEAPSNIVIDPVAVAAILRSPAGGVMRDLQRRGENVKKGAVAQVGKRTRALARTIAKRPGVDALGPYVIVSAGGPRAPHARLHHDGTRPHVIVPRRRKALRFLGSGSAPGNLNVVFARRVNHPGTRPNRFLTDSLPLARL